MFNCILILVLGIAFSDQRHFVNTYEKIMLSPEEFEVELYYINELPTLSLSDSQNLNILKLQVEIEIGMSEFLEVAFYNTFKEKPILVNDIFVSRNFEYDEYKIRLKYKVFKSENPWTPLFYSELKGKPDFSSWTIEQKLIFTKYFGNLNFSFNPIIAFENEKVSNKWEREFEFELAMGISHVRKQFSYGFDLKSSEYATYFGPVLGHGNEDKWWTIGFMKKMTGKESENEFIIKSIMGFHF